MFFLKSKLRASVYQEIVESFRLSSAEKLLKISDSVYLQDLAPTHADRNAVLGWTENFLNSDPIENLLSTAMRKIRDSKLNNQIR